MTKGAPTNPQNPKKHKQIKPFIFFGQSNIFLSIYSIVLRKSLIFLRTFFIFFGRFFIYLRKSSYSKGFPKVYGESPQLKDCLRNIEDLLSKTEGHHQEYDGIPLEIEGYQHKGLPMQH